MNHRLAFLRRKNLDKSIRKSREDREPVELIVKTHEGKKSSLVKELENLGEITHEFESIPYLSFKCDSHDGYEISQVFHKLSDSKAYRAIASSISVIDISSTFRIPNVTKESAAFSMSGVWNLEQIGTYLARQHASGEGVSVAVIDTGVDYGHPEVSRNFGSRKGYDFVRKDSDPMDMNGHGTHVAGIAAGKKYGVATRSSLYAVRVLDENGMGSEADTIAGLDWASKNSVDVINLSLGSPYASGALEDMCYYLANNGVLIAAAAGNDGFGPNYPAAFGDPVIAVAATDENKNHADFSNIYETNDISAPGVRITSSYGGGYAALSGTSMASPHVAGGLALVLSALKRDADLDELLDSTAEHLDSSGFPERDVYGAGLMRVDRMVERTLQLRRESPMENYGREVLNVLREVFWE